VTSSLTLVLLPGMDGTGDLFDAFVAAVSGGCRCKVVRYPVGEALGYPELEAPAEAARIVRGFVREVAQ